MTRILQTGSDIQLLFLENESNLSLRDMLSGLSWKRSLTKHDVRFTPASKGEIWYKIYIETHAALKKMHKRLCNTFNINLTPRTK